MVPRLARAALRERSREAASVAANAGHGADSPRLRVSALKNRDNSSSTAVGGRGARCFRTGRLRFGGARTEGSAARAGARRLTSPGNGGTPATRSRPRFLVRDRGTRSRRARATRCGSSSSALKLRLAALVDDACRRGAPGGRWRRRGGSTLRADALRGGLRTPAGCRRWLATIAAGCTARGDRLDRRGAAAPKPVAMTVMRISSPMLSSITAPKMMLASSCASSWMSVDGVVDLVQRQVGAAGDVDQHALGAADRHVLEQRAGDGLLRRLDGAVLAAAPMPEPMIAMPISAHDRAHVGEVEVDQPVHGDQVGDAAHRLQQHVVGPAEGLEHRGVARRGRRAGAGWG